MNTQTANFPKTLHRLVIAATLVGIGPSLAIADIININPIKDNTLYEYDPVFSIVTLLVSVVRNAVDGRLEKL